MLKNLQKTVCIALLIVLCAMGLNAQEPLKKTTLKESNFTEASTMTINGRQVMNRDGMKIMTQLPSEVLKQSPQRNRTIDGGASGGGTRGVIDWISWATVDWRVLGNMTNSTKIWGLYNRYDVNDLLNLGVVDGYLTTIMFQPVYLGTANPSLINSITLKVYTGGSVVGTTYDPGTLASSQSVIAPSVSWNYNMDYYVRLEEPVAITGTEEIWIGVEYNFLYGYIALADDGDDDDGDGGAGPFYPGKGDVTSMTSGTTTTWGQSGTVMNVTGGFPYNWYVWGCVEDEIPVSTCNVIIETSDEYGDGWTGGYLLFKDDDGNILDYISLFEGPSATFNHELPRGDIHCYWLPGPYDDEVGFVIKTPAGTILYTCNFGDFDGQSEGEFFVFSNTECPACPTPKNLTVEYTGDCDAVLSWTAQGGGTYNIYMDGTPVASGITATTYTHTGFDYAVGHTWEVSQDCGEESYMISVTLKACNDGCEDIQIGTGTTGIYGCPIDLYYEHSYSQQIYDAAELEICPGSPITSISFEYIYATPKNLTNQVVYMKNTTKSVFSSATDWESVSSADKVYTGNISAANGWVTIEFDVPFYYTGDNILVAINNGVGSWMNNPGAFWNGTSTGSNYKATYIRRDTDPFTPESVSPTGTNGGRLTNRPNAIFHVCEHEFTACNPPTNLQVGYDFFCNEAQLTWTLATGGGCTYNVYRDGDPVATDIFGGSYTDTGFDPTVGHTWEVETICEAGETASETISPSACSDGCDKELIGDLNSTEDTRNFPVGTYYDNSYTQQIFLSSEIGKPGEITSLSFRYIYTNPTTKNNLTVYLGNTTQSIFSGSNLTTYSWIPLSEMLEVFSGSITFSDGWITIPFDNAFDYTGCNLVVAVLNNNGDYDTGSNSTFRVSPVGFNRTVYWSVDGTTPINPDNLTSGGISGLSTNRANTVFHICDRYTPIVEAPLALAATDIDCSSFVANFSSDSYACFLLDVYTKGDVTTTDILEEDFSSITTGNDNTTSGSSTTWTGNINFPTVVKAYQAGGTVRLGNTTAPNQGSITSTELDLSGGDVEVSFDVKGWTSVEGDILVSIDGGTPQTVTYTATMDDSYESKTVTFPAATATSTVTIGTSARRAFLDNIVISVSSVPKTYIVNDKLICEEYSYLVDGLDTEETYYYTVKCPWECRVSAASNEISVTTLNAMYIVLAGAGTGGSVSPEGNVEVNCGEDQIFIFTPEDCYELDEVLISGTAIELDSIIDGVGYYTVENVTTDAVNISAAFKQFMYDVNVTINLPAGGTVTGGGTDIPCGTEITLTAEPSSTNYIFRYWTLNGVQILANPYTFIVTEDIEVVANFEMNCPDEVYDEVNDITYTTVSLAGVCWLKENLYSTKYQDGTEIPFAQPYMHQGAPVDVNIFGLLYYWNTIEGVCPIGWRIPTAAEWELLKIYEAKDLRNEYWLTPNENTNSTTFDVPGAGIFNSTLNRYENLYGYTAFWSSDEGSAPNTCICAVFTYFCNQIEMKEIKKLDAASVRCVQEFEIIEEEIKTVKVTNPQSNPLAEDVPGSVTYLVETENIEVAEAGTLLWYDCATDEPLLTLPEGLSWSINTGAETRTLTITGGSDMEAGTYCFKVVIDGVVSNMGTLVIDPCTPNIELGQASDNLCNDLFTIINDGVFVQNYDIIYGITTYCVDIDAEGTVEWFTGSGAPTTAPENIIVMISEGSANRTLTLRMDVLGGLQEIGDYYFRVKIDGTYSTFGVVHVVQCVW